MKLSAVSYQLSAKEMSRRKVQSSKFKVQISKLRLKVKPMAWIKQCIRMVTIQKEIKKIMAIPNSGNRETTLRSLAMELGCSLASTYTSDGKHIEEEVVRRIQEAARNHRESCLWLIAFMSAIASVFSALAAWAAVLRTLGR